jgi:hypothetical protein
MHSNFFRFLKLDFSGPPLCRRKFAFAESFSQDSPTITPSMLPAGAERDRSRDDRYHDDRVWRVVRNYQ